MTYAYFFLGLLIAGAVLQSGILYSLAIGFDFMVQDILWENTIGVTISSRAGLAARSGLVWPSKIINLIMRSPTHCEDAIAQDIQRAHEALSVLGAAK